MKLDQQIHQRRSIRLKEYDYSQPGAYFVTVVTQRRVSLFGIITDGMMRLNGLGEIISSVWLRLPKFFPIRHIEWVIMPNHLHAIVWIKDPDLGEESPGRSICCTIANASPLQRPIGTRCGSLGAIIQNFKSTSTRKINQKINDFGRGEELGRIDHGTVIPIAASASPKRIWQRNYYDHIVRNEAELERIRQYIILNPGQWATDEENPDRQG